MLLPTAREEILRSSRISGENAIPNYQELYIKEVEGATGSDPFLSQDLSISANYTSF